MKKVADFLIKNKLSVLPTIGLVGLIFFLPLLTSPLYAHNSSTADPDMQLLLQKLKERDAIIDDLNRRVKVLEGQQGSPAPQQQTTSTPVAPVNRAQTPDQQDPTARPNQQTRTNTQSEDPAKEKSSAGEFDVDELAAERALDRSLIQTGAILLPFRHVEIQPFFNYIRRDNNFPALVTNDIGQFGVRSGDIQRNDFDTGIFFRAGLPFESQLELRLPARIADQTTVAPIGLAGVNEVGRTGAALGDISVGIAKTLLRESNWVPDLVGRFTWDSSSGKITSNNVFMGTGFDEFRFSMTALKRQDPLAFTGSFDYQTALKNNGISLGDQYILSLGASLAASPYTSLALTLQQIWRDKTKIANTSVAESDAVQSIMSFGLTTRVTRKLFFTINGGIGLTDASPDYLINVSLPLRLTY